MELIGCDGMTWTGTRFPASMWPARRDVRRVPRPAGMRRAARSCK